MIEGDRFVQTTLCSRTITVMKLRLELRRAANVNVCHQTVHNCLHEFIFYSKRAAVRVPLTSAQRLARVA